MILTVLALTVACFSLPRVVIGTDFDSSWAAVLGYARLHNLRFGKEITFTYGPLGFAANWFYTSQAGGLRVGLSAILCLIAILGVCLLAWRVRPAVRGGFIAVFVFCAAGIERQHDFLIPLGLLSWGWVCMCDEGPGPSIGAAGLIGLSVLGGLAKFTFLLQALITLGIVSVVLALRGNRRLSAFLLPAFVLGLAMGWAAFGQRLADFGPFLKQQLTFSHSYAQAMAIEPLPELVWRGALIALLTFVSILGRTLAGSQGQTTVLRAQQGLLCLWLSALLYLAWKYGLVGADREHLQVFFGFAVMLLLAVGFLPSPPGRLRRYTQAGCLVGCLISLATLEWLMPQDVGASLLQPFRVATRNLSALARPRRYEAAMNQRLEAECAAAQLPEARRAIGQAPVDVFGSRQAFALFNGLNYHPRPVFQSYAAYNFDLMRLNERFYLSGSRPVYTLFELAPLTHRFPPLEDSLLLRDLLINYDCLQPGEPFLLLKARSNDALKLRLLSEGQARVGEQIPLVDYGTTNLWLEIGLRPSWRGAVQAFVYKPGRVRLKLWQGGDVEPGQTRTFRAPTSMLAAGFIASPALLTTRDVLGLYTGAAEMRPRAYALEVDPGTLGLWQNPFRFRVYQIQNRLGHARTD